MTQPRKLAQGSQAKAWLVDSRLHPTFGLSPFDSSNPYSGKASWRTLSL